MSDTIKERLIAYLRYKGVNNSEFGRIIGVSNAYISSIRKSIQPDKVEKISTNFPDLNMSWLITGDGEMLKGGGVPASINKEKETRPGRTIKYYPYVKATMGGLSFLENPNEISEDIMLPGYDDCQFAINAYGDSMYPLIKSGQIIVMKEWCERFIDWGKIYMVITKSGYRCVKRLVPCKDDDTKITCKSENPSGDYAPFDIEKDDILKMFLIKGWVCRDSI